MNMKKYFAAIENLKDIVVFKTLDGREHHDVDILIKQSDIPLDIHTEINWNGVKPISNAFVWNNLINIGTNSNIYIPNSDLDALIAIAHAIFEKGYIDEHDYKLISKGKIPKMYAEAEKMGWNNTFIYFWRCCKVGKLPIRLLAKGILETKAFNKLWGARYILWERFTHS